MPTPIPTALASRHVAVIGFGAAGLAAARELRREGHRVVVYERGSQVGGTWVYAPRAEHDPMGVDPARQVVHSSMYSSLRTNLPREVMGFKDFPFDDQSFGGDPRRFPGHREVVGYLEAFAREFGVEEAVRFGTEVVGVEEAEGRRWRVRSKRRIAGGQCQNQSQLEEGVEEVYDAVVVCNGHYTEPRVAVVPGIDSWPGREMHSHNYRTPDPFKGQVVVLIGNSASAVDISREIAGVAREVYVAARALADETCELQHGYENLWFYSMIERANADGSLVFRNGKVVVADIILHCTGYKYHFPFLETRGVVTVDDNRVGPLYKHVFPPALAPWLSFVGLPWKVVPFPLFEFQSKWIASVLSGRVSLPTQQEMMDDVDVFYLTLEASNVPKRYTHNIGDTQFQYDDWLAAQCGCSGVEAWREPMYWFASKNRRIRPETYRDEWEDDDLVAEAYKDFEKYTSKRNS